MYEVFENVDYRKPISHGTYETLDEARGCVEFDRIADWSIWCGNEIVESGRATASWPNHYANCARD